MEAALYGLDGFYSRGSGPGRGGADFLTSPEIGPLFGAVVANALDAWWQRLGEPDPFPIVEAGAGRGALANAIAAAHPRCEAAMAYVMVERSVATRAPEARDDLPAPGSLGPVGVVIANELLDNLVFKVLERVDGAWRELLVGEAGFAVGDAVAGFDHIDAPDGSRIPWHTGARTWLARAQNLFAASHIALIDYGTATTAELAARPWRDWLRTYRDHGMGKDPLRDVGEQDITSDIAFDQLAPRTLTTQADWLRAHGINALVDAARETWRERAHIGDLTALKARSRVNEADALLDPAGPGGFLVAEWF